MEGDSADEPQSLAEPQGVPCDECEKRSLGRGGTHQCSPAVRNRRSHAVEFVAEMAGRYDPSLVVLDLEKIEPGKSHRVARVIEDIAAIPARPARPPRPPPDPIRPERVVVSERRLECRQSTGDAIRLPRDVRADDTDQCVDTSFVLGSHAARHRTADAEPKHEQGNEHDHAKGGEEARAKSHGDGARWAVPSRSTVQRATPRRAIAVALVSTSAVIVAAHDGNKSFAPRHGSVVIRGSAMTYPHSLPPATAALRSSGARAAVAACVSAASRPASSRAVASARAYRKIGRAHV